MRLLNALRAPAMAAAIASSGLTSLAGMSGCAETPPPPPAGPPDYQTQQVRQRSEEGQQELDTAVGSNGQRVNPGYGAPPAAYPAQPQWGPGADARSTSGRPSWIERPNERYPDTHYLAAVGTGDEQNAAQDRAKLEIAKVFAAEITGVSETLKQFTLKSGQKETAVNASSLVQVSTEKALRGVRIAASWAGGGTTYALAVIERAPAARMVRDDIQRLDGEIRASLTAGDAAGDDRVGRFRGYSKALERMGEREGLNADLRILERGGGVPVPVPWEVIVAKLDGIETTLKVGVEVAAVIRVGELAGMATDVQDRIQSCLLQELGKMGIQATDDTVEGYDLLLKVRADFAPVDIIDETPVVRVDLALRVSDARKKTTLKTWTETEGRVGRPNYEAAISTAATKICVRSVPNISTNLKKLMRP